MKTVILANGTFPIRAEVLEKLENSDFIIACDGASDKLLNYGKEPNLIIGDLDSADATTLMKYKNIVQKVSRQDNTDLMKAMDWCVENKHTEVAILGATGGREDHTLGNLFAITTYASKLNLELFTDTGSFVVLDNSGSLQTYVGQQVSLFPQPQNMKITTKGLKYTLDNQALPYLYSGTLNEAETDSIYLEFYGGILLIYREY
ncbi:MAG: thiamine diphosphokinase [Flavobacteriaceae bacterium]|nr:thiamine diphosphokinase [Flavobacteriaceae bacterium]